MALCLTSLLLLVAQPGGLAEMEEQDNPGHQQSSADRVRSTSLGIATPLEYTPPPISYDLTPDDTTQKPADVLANRLHSILKIIGGELGAADNMPVEDDPEMDRVLAPTPTGENAPNPSTRTAQLASGAKGQFQAYARSRLAAFGMPEEDIGALITLWNRESGWNPNAQNPNSTAYGIAQFLNSTWQGTGISKTADPYKQIDAGLIYIKGRYGTPSAALAHSHANNWY